MSTGNEVEPDDNRTKCHSLPFNRNSLAVLVIVILCSFALISERKMIHFSSEVMSIVDGTDVDILYVNEERKDDEVKNDVERSNVKQREMESAKKNRFDVPYPSSSDWSKDGKKMNIVLLYADDWSFNMIGSMGNDYVKTPVLDQLATEGVLFTHNCVVASVCMQSRATLYTGQYSARHRTYKSWADVVMYEPERWRNTLYPQMMNESYHVGFFGKYHHLEPPPPEIPTFTSFRSAPYSHYFKRNGVEKHVTEWNEEDGLQFLDERPADQPFFMTISFFATHAEDGSPEQYRPMNTSMDMYVDEPVPLPKTYTDKHWNDLPFFFQDNNEGRSRFRSRYDTPDMYQHHMKNTCRMVTEVDTACGNIINKLKEQGIYDDTLIIFTTDNGNFHGQHGLAEKWYAFEESLRVPLIIKDPRMPKEMVGTKNDEFTLNIDLAPTILSAAGVHPPDVMQGRDIAPLYLQGDVAASTWRKEFLYDFHDGNPVIMNNLALVTKDYKYIYWEDFNYSQYFDLTADPFEEVDLFQGLDQNHIIESKLRLDKLNHYIKEDGTYF